jgi:hypothetical protein
VEVIMKTFRMVACASTVLLIFAVGCGGAPDAVEEMDRATDVEEPATAADAAAPAAPTAAEEQTTGQAPAERPRLAAPVRGEAALGYLKPVIKAGKTKQGQDGIITTFRLKNLAMGAIAGLQVEEFWYNKAGDPVTGSNYRHPRPLQPGEVVTVVLETPRNPGMDRNQYAFKHANGTIKTTLLQKME